MKDARDFSARTRANRISISARSRTEVGSSSRMTRWPPALFLERQRLGELDHLARGEIEVFGAHARIDIDLDLGQLARGRSVERAPVDDAEAGELPFVAEIDVLADRQVGEQRLLLEHHADALAVGIGRVGETGRPAGHQDLAGIGLIDAAQDLHQRRLAGAVLADQADDLAGPDLDRHLVSAHGRRGSACRP